MKTYYLSSWKRRFFFLIVTSIIGIYGCATIPETPEGGKSSLLVVGVPVFLHYKMNLKIYDDPDKNLSIYKTFAFDYINKENPLLEKELFKVLEKALANKGLKRDEDNPEILITMNFYVGESKKYIPPETITTTRIGHVWSTGHIGLTVTGAYVPVPITESQTKPGYTEISYYKNIRLNFLDYSKLKGGKKLETPPLVWVGEVDSGGQSSDIRAEAPALLDELIENFPRKPDTGIQMHRDVVQVKTLGIKGYGINGYRPIQRFFITEIDPYSQAKVEGLHEGDIIMKINGKELVVLQVVGIPVSDIVAAGYYAEAKKILVHPTTDKIRLEVYCPHSGATREVRLSPKEVTFIQRK